jgi:nucleotide-binding universal stress UspA family protein
MAETLNRVLAATDLSEPAEHAVRRALTVAEPSGAPVRLLHVLAEGPMQRLREVLSGGEAEAVRTAALSEAGERLETLRGRLAAEHAGELDAEVVAGNPNTAISAYAAERDCDLIVVGGSGVGRRSLAHPRAGITAQKVVRTADRPVLVARGEGNPDCAYRRVLVAMDFSASARRALDWALTVAPEASVHVLHVFELPYAQAIDFERFAGEAVARYREMGKAEAEQRLAELLAGYPDRCRPVVREGDPAYAVTAQAELLDVDLVAMGSRGQGVWSEALLGSSNAHLLQNGDRDLLSVRP